MARKKDVSICGFACLFEEIQGLLAQTVNYRERLSSCCKFCVLASVHWVTCSPAGA